MKIINSFKRKETVELKEPPLISIYTGFEEYLEKKARDKLPLFEKERLANIEKIRDYNDKIFNNAASYGFFIWLILFIGGAVIFSFILSILFVGVYSGVLSKKYPPELETREGFVNWKRIKRIAARKKKTIKITFKRKNKTQKVV